MGRTQSLSPDEAARVVAAVRDLLASTKYANNQSLLAPDLGIAQPTLSQMLGGKHDPGFGLARQVAALAKIPIEELLGTRVDYEGGEDRRIPSTAVGHHPDWPATKAEVLRRFHKTVDPVVLDEVALASFSNMPRQLTAEFVKQVHDALVLARQGDE